MMPVIFYFHRHDEIGLLHNLKSMRTSQGDERKNIL